MPHRLVQLLFLALLLSQCSQPVEFKRDSETDPQSDTYSPEKPRNLAVSFNTTKQNRLTWQITHVMFDSILIERKTTRDTNFVRLAAVAKNVTQFVDTTGFMTSPMSYRIASVFRRDGKEFISYSNSVNVVFGTINKPTITYNTTNYRINTHVSSTWKSNFTAEYWVKTHPDSSFRFLSVQPGGTGAYWQSVPFQQDVFTIDVAVVYLLGDETYRSVIDSTVRNVVIHAPATVTVNPMKEASAQVNWTNPFDFHDDILVRINEDEWVMPKSATSLSLQRYFRSGVLYPISVRYRRGNELGAESIISAAYSIQPPTLSFDGPTYPNITFRTQSTTAANSSFALGEYLVLEASKDMGPFEMIDSVKITSTSHSFDVAGKLDSLSTYRFRAKTMTSIPSGIISIRHKLAYGTRSESQTPFENRITQFSMYDDRYRGSSGNVGGIFDLMTGTMFFSIPAGSTTAPNGFTNNGHFVHRITTNPTSVTLRRYDGVGTVLGEFTLPAYTYHFGHDDDVIYLNTTTGAIERYHMPTATTTVLQTGFPPRAETNYAVDETHFLVKVAGRFVLFTHDGSGTYQLKSDRELNTLASEASSIHLSPTHIHMAISSSTIHSVNIDNGTVESFANPYQLSTLNHITDNEWVFFTGDQAIIRDVSQTSEVRIFFAPKGSFTMMHSKVRHRDGQLDMFFMRTSHDSGLPRQLIWLTKQHFWVVE